jgi:iron complex transport system substrate-binding protein
MLFELGYGNQIVGISDYCNFPEETKKITKIGGLDLNVEKIMSLKPNMVLDLNAMHRKYQLLFSQLGLNYVNFNVTSLEDIGIMAEKIASILGPTTQSSSFSSTWQTRIQELATTKADYRPRIYLEIWDAPMQAAGPKSFMGEMLRRCGGQNIISEPVDYPVMNSEQIIAADPEIILVAYPHPNLDQIKKRPGWSNISAIKKNQIHALNQDLFVRPGPRNLQALKILQNLIQPLK